MQTDQPHFRKVTRRGRDQWVVVAPRSMIEAGQTIEVATRRGTQTVAIARLGACFTEGGILKCYGYPAPKGGVGE